MNNDHLPAKVICSRNRLFLSCILPLLLLLLFSTSRVQATQGYWDTNFSFPYAGENGLVAHNGDLYLETESSDQNGDCRDGDCGTGTRTLDGNYSRGSLPGATDYILRAITSTLVAIFMVLPT